jgi:hypothetical protein
MWAQGFIGITGLLALILMSSRDTSLRRCAPIWGLMGQPFWLVVTWKAAQWGMFLLACGYTLIWLNSLYIYWLKHEPLETLITNWLDESELHD